MSETNDTHSTVTIYHTGGSVELDFDDTEADIVQYIIDGSMEPDSRIELSLDAEDVYIYTNHIIRIDVTK